MKLTREEARKRLLARATAAVEELLAWNDQADKPTLTEIEDVVLRLRKEIGIEMAQEAIALQESNQPVCGPLCPSCGQEMGYKGQKGHSVESRTGTLTGERGYYHCPECGEGIFPPGPTTGAERQALERGASPPGGMADRAGAF